MTRDEDQYHHHESLDPSWGHGDTSLVEHCTSCPPLTVMGKGLGHGKTFCGPHRRSEEKNRKKWRIYTLAIAHLTYTDHSSSSAFPAISLGFTILGKIFVYVTIF